jgi:hypothetical protein
MARVGADLSVRSSRVPDASFMREYIYDRSIQHNTFDSITCSKPFPSLTIHASIVAIGRCRIAWLQHSLLILNNTYTAQLVVVVNITRINVA